MVPRALVAIIAIKSPTKKLLEILGGLHFANAAYNLPSSYDIVSVWQHL